MQQTGGACWCWWLCALVALCAMHVGDAAMAGNELLESLVVLADSEGRTLRNAIDGACFVALATGVVRLIASGTGSGWRVPAGSMAAAAAAGALVPRYMQASPWSLAVFSGCALVGFY
jgi:hypothetical protein